MPLLSAKPKSLEIDLARTALIVVDMQNAFACKGGMLDRRGSDLSGAPLVIGNNAAILAAARRAGIKVVYLQMGYRADLSDAGGKESPNWEKEYALRTMRQNPELRGKILTEDSWDFEFADGLQPQKGEMVVKKTRYSGFVGTPLDSILRTDGIKYLFFTGIASNVCVESTIRNAFFLDYWPILISDATLPSGPAFLQEATIHNVMTFFGWVSSTGEVVKALEA
jgi:ureidoacrylate peracid hydrolase